MEDKKIDILSKNMVSLVMEINKKVLKSDEFVKSFPMPPSQVKVMVYLYTSGPASVSKISKDLLISKPNMTPIIDRLIEQGLVIKHDNPDDRRVTILKCSDDGVACLKSHHEMIKKTAASRLSSLSEDDVNNLCGLTSEILSILSKIN